MDLYTKYLQHAKTNQSANEYESAQDRVVIVDGLNIFMRAFAVVPTVSANSGEHTGGVVGFFRTLSKIIKEQNPNELIVVVDGEGGSYRRRKIYKDYKGKRVSGTSFNRPQFLQGMDEHESLARQLQIVFEILQVLPIKVFSIDGIEADDVIAYLIADVLDTNRHKLIVSSDKDFLQLIGPNVSQYYSPMKAEITEDSVARFFGYTPKNYLTLRCFTGDPSDNIKGVHGVGSKSLNKRFGLNDVTTHKSVNDIIQDAQRNMQDGSKIKLYEKICNQAEIAHRNYRLMQLQDPEISSSIKSSIRNIYNNYDLPKFNRNQLIEILVENDLQEILQDAHRWWLLFNRFN